MQIACQIPTKHEITIPQKLFIESHWKAISLKILHIPLLKFIVTTSHLRVETNILWQPIEAELPKNIPPFRLAPDTFEWFPRPIDW